MSNKELSIIIVNYKSRNYLEKCLTSVQAKIAGKIDSEIIVINNDEEELNEVKIKYPEIKLIHSGKNIGFGAAHNLGAKKAQGEILLLLNPDSEIFSENIEEIKKLFQNNKNVGIVGSGIYSQDGFVREWTFGKETNLFNLIKDNLKINKNRKPENKKMAAVDWVSGAAIFIRNDSFKKLGGFDEKFFMYFEDMDLCLRLRKIGEKIYHYPNFCIVHFGGASYTDKEAQKMDYYRSQDYYFKKHRSVLELWLVKILRKIFSNAI